MIKDMIALLKKKFLRLSEHSTLAIQAMHTIQVAKCAILHCSGKRTLRNLRWAAETDGEFK
jgi:hypothetical protein